MTGPSMLEPQFSRRDYDPPEANWERCGLCCEPVDPDAATKLDGFGDAVFHQPCASLYCREHDEFECQEEHHADR